MSFYQSFLVNTGAQIILPLEEDTASVVNVGMLGGAVTGVHVDTQNQQASMINDADFSMRYKPDSYTNVTSSTDFSLGTICFKLTLDLLDEDICTIYNSTVPNSEVLFTIVNGNVSIVNINETIDTGIQLSLGVHYHLCFDYDGLNLRVYGEGLLLRTYPYTLAASTFNKLDISSINPVSLDHLVDNIGDRLIDSPSGSQLVGS